MSPSDSPFDNAEFMNSGQANPRRMGFFGFLMRAILFIFLLGFGAAFYLLVWHPHHAAIKPAAVGPQAAPVLPVGPAAASSSGSGLGGLLGTAGGGGGVSGSSTGGIGQMIASLFGGTSNTAGDANSGIKASLAIDHAKDQAAAAQQVQASPTASTTTMVSTPIVVPGAITDIINSPVMDENGHQIGTIYDILVDRHTGLATRVIVNNGQPGYQGIDLSEVHFNQVAAQSASGAMEISTSAASMKAGQSFTYAQMPKDQYVSLRGLEGTIVLDDQAKSAGRVNAVTYANGSAQNIVYTVPSTIAGGRSVSFVIPYAAVKIITAPAGQAIQLSHGQTAAMAATLFPTTAKK